MFILKNSSGEGRGPIDWMCVARYALYGALIGGLVANWVISASGIVVYTGAAVGALLLGTIKLLFIPD